MLTYYNPYYTTLLFNFDKNQFIKRMILGSYSLHAKVLVIALTVHIKHNNWRHVYGKIIHVKLRPTTLFNSHSGPAIIQIVLIPCHSARLTILIQIRPSQMTKMFSK
jgi:hypothetical protein